ncbi:MAG TPA: RluA family pseudouridine synthase [Polyangiaceae bacterium]|nr:RluA family pseudouridine synthase [Polyangiaceae bacterium]
MSRLRVSECRFVRPADVADGAVVSVFRVQPERSGQRVDVFVQGQLHRTSRTRAQAIVRASAYDEAGRRLKVNDRVRPGQLVLLWRPPWDERLEPIPIQVLWEDEHLLAVSKPPLLAVHPTARHHKNTLIKLLQAERPECRFLSLGHRLDRETSGVIVISKTPECDRRLKKQIEARRVEKTYVALTWGVPDRGDGAKVFRYERGLELDSAHPLRVKMRVRDGPGALYAATRVEVVSVRRVSDERAYAWVRCGLETGRQHQIRVHLATLGAPVVGDKLYGPDESAFARAADDELTDEDLERLEMSRHALHAARLELSHPITDARLVIEAPLPADMTEFWESLGKRTPCRSVKDLAAPCRGPVARAPLE